MGKWSCWVCGVRLFLGRCRPKLMFSSFISSVDIRVVAIFSNDYYSKCGWPKSWMHMDSLTYKQLMCDSTNQSSSKAVVTWWDPEKHRRPEQVQCSHCWPRDYLCCLSPAGWLSQRQCQWTQRSGWSPCSRPLLEHPFYLMPCCPRRKYLKRKILER